MPTRPLGKHLLIEYYDCDPAVLNDQARIRSLMLDAAVKANATVISDIFHSFSPHGVSGVVVVAESHIAIHTWPEYKCAAVDVFSCSEKMTTSVICEILRNGLGAKRLSKQEIARGSARHG